MNRRLLLVVAALGTLAWARPAFAVPVLQLDIAGGVYNTLTETVVATNNPFTLYAILTPKNNATPDDIAKMLAKTYYVAAALVPKVGPDNEDLNVFTFNGDTINATTDMTYGTPPIEEITPLQGHDPGDLSTHGIYDTFFAEFAFTFSSSSTAATYDSADNPGGLVAGGQSYYAAFAVNTLPLHTDYVVHFDLYDVSIRECAAKKKASPNTLCPDVDVDSFAPFSHDAESFVVKANVEPPPPPPPPPPVPEPATVVMIGAGLGLAAIRKWSRRS